MRIVIFLFILQLYANLLAAQSKYPKSVYAKRPVWIQMMQEPNPNYFEVTEAYETYWANHILLNDELELKLEHKARPTKEQKALLKANAQMRKHIAAYKSWLIKVTPYVQNDGSILMPTKE